MRIVSALETESMRRELAGAAADVGAEVVSVAVVLGPHLSECDCAFVEWRLEQNASPVLEALRMANAREPATPVVVLVPKGARILFHRAMQAGAADVLFSPPAPGEIAAEVEELAGHGRDLLDPEARQQLARLQESVLVGGSPAFTKCIEQMKKAARSDANVLLIGETGTGKDLVARAIHDLSRRRNERFEPLNCATLDGHLAGSELFGHVKGAFTGAERTKDGWFTAVGAGTLLLDEIGDLDLSIQVKLLRAIEQRTFHRVGDTAAMPFHARLICATLCDLDAAVQQKQFREDLLGRIDQYRIVLPPLRERRADLRPLAWHFVEKHCRGRKIELSESALSVLDDYHYPKNVRELESAIIGAIANTGSRATILPQDFPGGIRRGATSKETTVGHELRIPGGLTYQDAREAALTAVDEIYLTRLLTANQGNQSAAAEAADIDRKTFATRLARAKEGRKA
jgi:DNA-binding NtrC family response regulator